MIFWCFSLNDKFTDAALERTYDSVHSFGATYGEHKRFLEFSHDDYLNLQKFAKDINIAMTASAMDPVSVDVVNTVLAMPLVKIGSGDANNPIVLEKVAKLENTNAVISTGMCELEDVQRIYKLFKYYRKEKNNFVLLHCTSSYPTALESVNLNVITWYNS